MRKQKLICAVLTAIFLWTAGMAAAETEALSAGSGAPSMDWFEEKGLTLGDSSLAYPALREGTVAEELRTAINERILEDGKIREYLTRVSQLISGGKLKVSWRGTVLGPVFSFAVSAGGAVTGPRSAYVWTAGNIDLRNGQEVTLEEIFPDPEAARAEMEAYLEEEVAPELSAHLLNSEVTPLPELFRFDERGIVWMYPTNQLSTLSDRAGDILIPWQVIQDQLDPAADGIPAAMGVTSLLPLTADASEEALREAADRIRAMTAAGEMPGIPVRLGDSLQALTDEWHLLIDPDVYIGGRLFSLEGGGFRGVFLMTDFLSESWEHSVVDGIRSDVGGCFGLAVGETVRETWLQMLGEPDHTIMMDEETAEAYRTVPGSRDYYEFGDHRLQLHADEEGVLVSVILSE